jgi:two-component system, response regulator
MKGKLNTINILMADDDPDDRMLMKEALEENNLPSNIAFVEDGKELLDYLHKRGQFAMKDTLKPGLILLDLNMPKIDGREALRIIKSDPLHRRIPVVVLTTSKAEEDVFKTYDLGVNSFICKPVKFEELVQITKEIGIYWFSTVALPKY